ncbi:MAG TPA: NADP-dependent isocitrate dehydrogenase, partial [Candidatus Xenobia bacterium]
MSNQKITVAKGDGIGPEIMDATLAILQAAKARLEYEHIDVGEACYLGGHSSGFSPETMKTIERNKILLKAPITTPQGGGYKSLNVTIRKTLGLYSNVRPVRSLHPFVPSKSPKMNLVIVRENEEDLYAGIEYQQTPEVTMALKFITRPGCERIIRFGFEYARAVGAKKVTCMTKDNILKLTDGLFHKIFEEVSPEYEEIEKDHWIIDIGMAKLADTPETFQVIIMPNMYGDIASDVVAQISGSVGLAGSANIGDDYAMFEAIHGSAPRHAGKNMANPSGLLQGAVMMLVHLAQYDVASAIENAWLRTLEDKIFTYDLARNARHFGDEKFTEVGTKEFAEAVIQRLGQKPQSLTAAAYDG